MDTSAQLYESDATGWQRGLYADVKATFRAPIVNWFFRTLTANDPAFTRYLWAQLKPLYGTRAFGEFTVAYRDAVLTPLAEGIEEYRAADLDCGPAADRELRGQMATFDVVAPRLALTFAVCDRRTHGEPVGTDPDDRAAATAPLPAWLDRDRGLAPTMLDEEGVPDRLDETVAGIRDFHGLDGGLPSVYRCLAQWPGYLERAWDDLEPVLRSDAFERAMAEAASVVDEHVASLPYVPRLAPADLRARGHDEDDVAAFQSFFEGFARGPVESVIPALHAYAATLGVAGERSL